MRGIREHKDCTMKKSLGIFLLGLVAAFGLNTFSVGAAGADRPSHNSTVTFLYYDDIERAASFYETVLGLQKQLDSEWVKMYRLTAGGTLGLVDRRRTKLDLEDMSLDLEELKSKPVMLSFETSELEEWYARLRVTVPEIFREHLVIAPPDEPGFSNNFSILDPEGYVIEFFEWRPGQRPATDEPPIDKYSYRLGGFGTFSELVRVGVKELALSSAIMPAEMDVFEKEATRIAEEEGIKVYREPDLLVTDLFPAEVSEGKDVLLIYKGSTLDKYLALKREKAALLAAGKYSGEARKNLARKFGKLLSYPDETIEARLNRGH